MNTWNPQANELFLRAIEHASPEDRRRFLDGACDGDAGLRAEVEGLLAAGDQAGSFLEVPVNGAYLAATIQRPIAEQPGTMIGHYKLLEQIGEGGFGVVFMAEQQEPVRRKVALKVLKPGMDTRQVIARFEAERQALALMDHPNIAHVFDGGSTDAGRLYFVMELVRGVPITEFCDQSHMAIRERLALFVDVCQAVQHAHQKGIIHRDIKPTNVMVTLHDGTPVVKVIDFGIAKAMGQQLTEKTLFTNFAQLIGTPLYMSPEQAEMSGLDVDTRSDIYSLGVLLYELLTGTTPFENERLSKVGYDEMRRIIREEEPPKPSTRISTVGKLATTASQKRQADPRKLSKLFRGELDWIVMKALEKDRNRRYETANAFALDVERYLNDEQVVACPPSANYRLRKFARRNKRILAAATLLTTTLVLGAAVSTWQAIRATEATGVARSKEAEAIRQAAKAKAVSDLMQEMLGSANPDRAKGAEYTVRQLLDDFSGKLGDQLKDQPEVEATIRATIGNAYQRLGLPDRAEPHLRAALALRRRIFSSDDMLVAQSLRDLAMNTFQSGDVVDAEKLSREALAIHDSLNVANGETVNILDTLLLILCEDSRHVEAEQMGERALAIARQRPGQYPEVATVLHRMAAAVKYQGDLAKAERLSREAVTLHRQLHGENHPETAWGLAGLADILMRQQQFDEAEACLREAIAIFQRHFGAKHKSLTNSYRQLAELLKSQGKTTELVDRERLAQALRSVQRSENDAGAWTQLALAHARLGEWSAVNACFEKLIELGRGSTEKAKYEIADGCSQVGRLLRENAQTDPAENVFRNAISLREPLPEVGAEVRLAQMRDYDELCQLLTASGRLEEALAVYEKLNALASKTKEATGWEFYHVANQFAAMGHFREAVAAFDRSLEVNPSIMDSYYRGGPLHAALGDAEAYHRVCHEMIERLADTDDPGLAQCAAKACLMVPDGLSLDDFERIQKLAERAITGTENHGYYHYFAMAKGLADYRAGRYQDAIQWTQRWAPQENGVHWDASRLAVIAMAHHKLHDTEEAEAALASAKAIMTKMPDPAKGEPFDFYDWFEWLQAQLLCREAEATLNKPATETGP